MPHEINGMLPTNPNVVTLFNPVQPDDDLMITEDGFDMGTENLSLMELEEGS